VNARNACEALVHTVKKSLKEHGDKLEAADKDGIEAALKDAEGVLKSESKSEIEAKAEALAKAAQKLGEKVYAQSQQAAQGAAQAEPGASAGEPKQPDGDVVDAEYTEVKDKQAG
jgi:molecular chaperone DnaK